MESRAGDGFGIMMGDGLAVYDFDHCVVGGGVVTDRVAGYARAIVDPVLYVEASSSGDGVHVFVESYGKSFKRGGVEFYSRARFVRMTGCPFRGLESGRG